MWSYKWGAKINFVRPGEIYYASEASERRKSCVQTCPDMAKMWCPDMSGHILSPQQGVGRGTRATYVLNPTARVSQIFPVDPVDPLILILHSLSRKGISLNKALRILVIPRCSPIASASFALYGVLKHLVSRKCCVAGVRRGENLVDSEKNVRRNLFCSPLVYP